jgi:putative ABC transport system substrate-binding protein
VGPAFQRGLKEGGFVEGQNVGLEFRWANNDIGRLPELAADLVRRRVSVVVAIGNNLPARAAKAATSTIPIVFVNGIDPVTSGLVASIARPDANITGVTVLAADLMEKRMQLLHDVVPAAKVFGVLFNPDNPPRPNFSNGRANSRTLQDIVRSWGASIEFAGVRTVAEFEPAVAGLAKRRVEALATSGDVLFSGGQLAPIAANHSLPTIFMTPAGVHAGGLMSYNASIADAYQQAGRYVARILHGAKPADLPVLLPTRFEFVINLKTARALSLEIPPMLLAFADEVIE